MRHAQARHNADAVVRGMRAYYDPANRDAALTEYGRETARARRGCVGEPTEYDAVFCSPLQRVWETLLELMPAARGHPVVLDDRLMEPQDAVCNCRAELSELVAACPVGWDFRGVAEENPFGREGAEGLDGRVRAFGESMVERFPDGGRVLVVAHHDWIRSWFAQYGSIEGLSVPNCGVVQWHDSAKS